MSKDKKAVSQVVDASASFVPPVADVMPVVEDRKLSAEDKSVLDLAKSRRAEVKAQLETAVAKNDAAELAFRYVVLQLYMKNGLDSSDAISEDGSILIGGANQQTPQQ